MPPPFLCPNCDQVFTCKQNVQKHLARAVCTKQAPELPRCPKCNKQFGRPCRYRDHIAKCTFGDPPAVHSTGASTSTIVGDVARDVNNTTIQGDVTNNTIHGDVNNYTINGFSTTDIELVKQAILRDPSLLQLAHEMECVHEQLTAMTHFHGAAQNRNVLSGDMKTSSMKVLNGSGQPMKITRAECEDAIYFRNAKIARSESVRPFVNGDIIMSLDPKEQKRDKRKIAVTVENKGAYSKFDAVQRAIPVYEPLTQKQRDVVWDSMLDRVGASEYWPPAGLAEDASQLLTVFIRHPRLWMKLPDGLKILDAEQFKAEVYDQTAKIMEEFHGMCYRRYDRGGITRRMFGEVESHMYDFGANVMSVIYSEGGGAL
jgi:uncharacterized C2H2 Zn-finger protein